MFLVSIIFYIIFNKDSNINTAYYQERTIFSEKCAISADKLHGNIKVDFYCAFNICYYITFKIYR